MQSENAKPKTVHVDVLPDGAENVHYDEPGIPVYLQGGMLSMYPDYRASAHWHKDVELLLIRSGEMEYNIDGSIIRLRSGDIIAVNSRHLHFGYSESHHECGMLCLSSIRSGSYRMSSCKGNM